MRAHYYYCEEPRVEELLVLVVHPHLDHPLVVDCDYWALGLLGQLTFDVSSAIVIFLFQSFIILPKLYGMKAR